MDYSLLLGIEKVVKQEENRHMASISDHNFGNFFNQVRNNIPSSKGSSNKAEINSKNTTKSERKETIRSSSVHLNTSYN